MIEFLLSVILAPLREDEASIPKVEFEAEPPADSIELDVTEPEDEIDIENIGSFTDSEGLAECQSLDQTPLGPPIGELGGPEFNHILGRCTQVTLYGSYYECTVSADGLSWVLEVVQGTIDVQQQVDCSFCDTQIQVGEVCNPPPAQ